MSGATNEAGRDDLSRDQEHDKEKSNVIRGLWANFRMQDGSLGDACRGASATVTELGEEAYQIGTRTGARIARGVEAQPMTSILVAGSLGLIAGLLLARR